MWAALGTGAPCLWPEHGSNVVASFEAGWDDDVLAGAEVVARGRLVNQRVAPVPMEGNAIAVQPHGDGTYTAWVSTQVPFDVRDDLADALGVEKEDVRTIAPDVGGGFGAKLQVYPEYLVVAAVAARLGRPVRWIESRSEGLVALTHGRAQVQRVEIGARRDGTLVGLRADLIADMGAYPIGAFLPNTTHEMLGRLRDPAHRLEGPKRPHERDTRRAVPGSQQARGDRADRTSDRSRRRRARHGPARSATPQPDPSRLLPVPDGVGHRLRRRRVRTSTGRGDATRRDRRPSRRANLPPGTRRPPRPGHRIRDLRRDHVVQLQGVRLGRGARGRHGHGGDGDLAARARPRDRVRATRVGCARRAARVGPGCALRHGAREAERARGARARCRRAARRCSSAATRSSSGPAHWPRTCSRPTRPDLEPADGGGFAVRGAPERSLTLAELAGASRASTLPTDSSRACSPRACIASPRPPSRSERTSPWWRWTRRRARSARATRGGG